MSERNPFSKFFNKNDDSDDSVREDIIPVAEHFSFASDENNNETPDAKDRFIFSENQEPASDKAEKATDTAAFTTENASADEKDRPEEVKTDNEAKENAEEGADSIPSARFIKASNTPFISTAAGSEDEIPTTATKYTDRLLPKVPERKQHTGYTGKINTYTANHSPAPGSVKFIPADSSEVQQAREKAPKPLPPEKTAMPQTKLTPSEIAPVQEEQTDPKVIVEKLPEKQASDKTKHIVSKGELLREIAKSSSSSPDDLTEESENQMMMEGFSEDEEREREALAADEAELEKELSAVRQKRIKNFRFWTKSATETGESEDKSFSAPKEDKHLPSSLDKISKRFSHLNTDFASTSCDEYTDPSKRKEVFSHLINIRKSAILKAFAVALTGIILIIINISASLSASLHNGFFTIFGGSSVVYNSVNLFLLVIAGILMAEDLKKGLFSILKIRPRADSALLFMYIGALAQNITAYFSSLKPESEYHLITGAVVLLSVPVLAAKVFYYDSTRQCFKAVAAASDKSYLRKVSDTSLIASLLKDSSNSETNVVYAGKTRFISGFLKRGAAAAFSAQASSRVTALTFLLSIIAGIIGIIITKSPVYALGCLTATAAFAFPVSSLVFTGYMLRNENTVLSVKSSYVQTYADAHVFCCVDDIIVDGADIFSAEIVSSSCNKNVSRGQAEFCAAALTNKTDGILKEAFSALASDYQDRFPEVENLVFEDKLGFSAWISDCRILLGTKDFLISHNVELPKDHTIPFVLDNNSKPIFLAIEGHFAAVFSVRYSCNPTAAKSLCDLAKNGANILISVKDPNITEEFGEKLLGLPEHSLRIIKNSTNESFIASKNTVTDSEETGIVFSDSFDTFSRTMASAIKLDKTKAVSRLLTETLATAGALFGVILSLTGAKAGLNSYLPVILQFFFIFTGFVITPTLCATSLKEKIKLPENMVTRLKDIAAEREESDEDSYTDNEEAGNTDESSTAYDNAEEKISEPTASFTDSSVEENSKDEQMIMQGAPYTSPPEVIDFSKITGEEEQAEESTEKTVSDDILDAFAGDKPSSVQNRKTQKSKGRASVFGKLGFSSAGRTSSEEKERKQPFMFSDDTMPPPPKYELNKKDDKTEDDPLSFSFVPPEKDSASRVYSDDFFASYDTAEDDKAFEAIRKQRKEADEDNIFGF